MVCIETSFGIIDETSLVFQTEPVLYLGTLHQEAEILNAKNILEQF